jgi:ERCC4-type nuclease
MNINGKTPHPPIPVLVDHREARSATVPLLEAADDFAVTFDHLATGDYHVDRTFVFERKRLCDLAMSIQGGRVFRQAKALAELAPPLRGAIILEGTSADFTESAMRREAIQGALITVSLFFGVPVLRSRNAEETVALMRYAARQGRWFATGAIARHGKRPKGKRRAQLALLQGLPGVGPERAAQLLDRFGSVEGVLTASHEALAAVPGIGPGTAKKIRWLVREETSLGYGG